MKPKVCVFHQTLLQSFGGAASVCAWILEALKDDFALFLATPDRSVEAEYLNRLYGTNLSDRDFECVHLAGSGGFGKAFTKRGKSLRLAVAIRELVGLACQFDLIVNTVNEVAFPFPTVQYIHFPIRSYKAISALYPAPERWLRNLNNLLFRLVSGTFGGVFAPGTAFIANSQWTASRFRESYGITADVVYPPVKLSTEKAAQSGLRETGFVAVGRFVPEKRMHEAIELVDIVRQKHPEIHLHLVGDGAGPYADTLERMAATRPHVQIHKRVSREHLSSILLSHQFGVHPTPNEHFGMAPAEMAEAGELVFVRNSGGQVEIVDFAEELIFDRVNEGADKALRVMSDDNLRKTLLERLDKTRQRFSLDNFISNIRMIVSRNIASGNGI